VDIGDILIAIFIVSGILSSLAGGKKKKKQQSRPPQRRPQPRPSLPPSREGAGAGARPRPSLDPSHSGPVPTQMEEILRQLGLEVGPEIEEPEVVVEREAVRPELPKVVPLERPPQRTVALDSDSEARHTKFHDEYIDAFEQTRIERPPSRGKKLLNPQSLRQAMLLREILGPPKGMR
jgi:hypothetical protein